MEFSWTSRKGYSTVFISFCNGWWISLSKSIVIISIFIKYFHNGYTAIRKSLCTPQSCSACQHVWTDVHAYGDKAQEVSFDAEYPTDPYPSSREENFTNTVWNLISFYFSIQMDWKYLGMLFSFCALKKSLDFAAEAEPCKNPALMQVC